MRTQRMHRVLRDSWHALLGDVGWDASPATSRSNPGGRSTIVEIDITGDHYGQLTVLARAGAAASHARWRVRCDCGKERDVSGPHLRSGNTRSCGCLRAEVTSVLRRRHGHATGEFTPTYRSWRAMMDRYRSETDGRSHRYRRSGITVCERWRGPDGFVNFLADMGERPPGTTLDRHDNNNGSYEPGNCRWATPTELANNQPGRIHAALS